MRCRVEGPCTNCVPGRTLWHVSSGRGKTFQYARQKGGCELVLAFKSEKSARQWIASRRKAKGKR